MNGHRPFRVVTRALLWVAIVIAGLIIIFYLFQFVEARLLPANF